MHTFVHRQTAVKQLVKRLVKRRVKRLRVLTGRAGPATEAVAGGVRRRERETGGGESARGMRGGERGAKENDRSESGIIRYSMVVHKDNESKCMGV